MQLITDEMTGYVANSSMIRKMFEAGIELQKKYGADNVYDFSLGNPDLPPPPAVKKTMLKIAETMDQPFALGYMPNAGYPAAREALARKLSQEQGLTIPASNVIVTCGAAGAINVFFRATLSKDDEVITPCPYFVEYDFYVGNFGGKLIRVPSDPNTFALDLAALEQAINSKTRAMIVNTPNNPTGQIYSRESMKKLAEILRRKSAEYGHPIFLVADEPYRFLNFDNVDIPSVFELYEYSVIVGSFSKSLSLAGERAGYLAVNPAMPDCSTLLSACTITKRILGYVNAPAIAQKILIDCIDSQVDLDIYRRRRDLMADVLDYAGIDYATPRGAFYFFPKSPVADEMQLVNALFEERILVVPGRGFGMSGYVRMAFCVTESSITGSKEGFKRAVDRVKAGLQNK